MKKTRIYLNEIDKVKKFVNVASKQEFNIYITSGRYVIDAKSIMGIFSLDLSQELEISIEKCTDKEYEKFLKAIEMFVVK